MKEVFYLKGHSQKRLTNTAVFKTCSFLDLLVFFYNIGLPMEDIFSGHLLSPVFQSSLRITCLQAVPHVWYDAKVFLVLCPLLLNPLT